MKLPNELRTKRALTALVLAGGLSFGVIGTASTAMAESVPSPSTSSSAEATASLSASNTTSVIKAVQAKYPDATIKGVQIDPDGGYEVRTTTADGEQLVVALDEGFTVTGTKEGRGGRGGPGMGGQELSAANTASVSEAVLAKYPDATVQKSFASPDGGYRAMITTADGDRLIVVLDESFTVTGTETPRAGGHGLRPQADASTAPKTEEQEESSTSEPSLFIS